MGIRKITGAKYLGGAAIGVAILLSSSANAALDNWGTGADSSTLTCASFSTTCSTGTSPGTFAGRQDNLRMSSASSSVSDVRGSASVTSTIEEVSAGLNSIVIRATAQGGTGLAFATGWGIDGYTYSGSETITLEIGATLTGTVSNPVGSAFNDISASLAILSESDLDGFESTDLFGCFGECFNPSEEAFLSLDATGSDMATLSIMLNPGDTFYLWSTMSLGAAVGGSTDSSNSLSYSFSETDGLTSSSTAAAVVPVPAAIWMLGSALLGLFGVRRAS